MAKEKVLKATHHGTLKIGEKELSCAVLEDGTRIISRNAIFRAFGRTKRGRKKGEIRVLNMPSFIDAKNLQPFINKDLEGVLKQIRYRDKNGREAEAYSAEIIPLLCDVYLEARNAKVLTSQQEPLAVASEILVRALSKIGITALIDEATGYQYDREQDELQKILKKYISEELLPWQSRFPDSFYKELFRLNGWDFTVNGIKKRPGVIGRWTNQLIYEELPDGVLKELQENVPKSASGNKTARLHQLLTLDVGHPHLTAQINQILTLFRLSENMEHMWTQFKKLQSRKSGQLEFDLKFDEKGHTITPVEEDTLSDFNKKLKRGLEYSEKD